jgi:hypothetical protein
MLLGSMLMNDIGVSTCGVERTAEVKAGNVFYRRIQRLSQEKETLENRRLPRVVPPEDHGQRRKRDVAAVREAFEVLESNSC